MLASMEAESVHCCVTSPPYWGLRDYGTAKWEGGDSSCDHQEPVSLRRDSPGGFHNSKSRGTQLATIAVARQYKDVCRKCGAARKDHQLGLEKTPQEYVDKLVEVFRGVRRVLRKDGTLWLNLGDCYASSGGAGFQGKHTARANRTHTQRTLKKKSATNGLKPKDLVGIPWRVAFALQADGWYLRADVIWHKPNPIPESVRDRPTRCHESIFLLTKSPRYFYDYEAAREPTQSDAYDRKRMKEGRVRMGGKIGNCEYMDARFAANRRANIGKQSKVGDGEMRNRRTVWRVPTTAFAGAHFATFPTALIEPCILAGCPVAGRVLDPFFGAGTTGLVALKHGRECVGIELNPSYVKIAEARLKEVQTQFGGLNGR